MNERIGLDFETYSAVNLSTSGLVNYVNDSTFRVLVASVAYHHQRVETFDFVLDDEAILKLAAALEDKEICAHNAGFEKMVLKSLGIDLPSNRFIDSAVVARAAGAGSSLAAAAPQLLDIDKLDENRALINKFCVPSRTQLEEGVLEFQTWLTQEGGWADLKAYCELDAFLSLQIVSSYSDAITDQEYLYMGITLDMNEVGWPLDVSLVYDMQVRYEKNKMRALAWFQKEHKAADLNLNSLKQLKEWCADRKIKASSFDEKHVAKLLARIQEKLATTGQLTNVQERDYRAVRDLLVTKQILGGSSLKKLQVMIDTQYNSRLYDQYLHCGAGQTLRTTGRSVQMQNLKRMPEVADVDELDDSTVMWDNGKLAENLRQVFTTAHHGGQLIVGDFSSVESRGLAWLAGEDWKLASYRKGLDLYRVLASKIYSVPVLSITKDQRQTGKVGELSCGYGAGPDAVVSFAEGMGVELELGEATKLVWDWRQANPKILELWKNLDSMLHIVVETKQSQYLTLPDGMTLALNPMSMPASLAKMVPAGVSVAMVIRHKDRTTYMKRYFHGCHVRGRNICYFKPSDRKTGDLWRNTFIDPKTKQRRFYELYGGKLAGILTQSLCREVFFNALANVSYWTHHSEQLTLIGQFHDEIVVDWQPGPLLINQAVDRMKQLMSDAGRLTTFPLAADIKHDYRYTK